MNDKLKRRLAGAAVLLAATFIAVSLLPTPEQAARPDTDVVTIPLHDIESPPPPAMVAQGVPQTLAAPDLAPGRGGAADEGVDPGLQDVGSSGDDDAGGALTPAPAKRARPAAPDTLRSPADEVTVDDAVADATPAAPPRKPVGKPMESPPPVTEPEGKPAGEKSAHKAAPPVAAPAATAPPAAAPAATVPAPALAASPAGRWFVQVGGFADIENARQVQARLQAIGEPNILAPVDTRKGTIYRVRGGPYASEAAAQAGLAKIKSAGYAAAQLVSP